MKNNVGRAPEASIGQRAHEPKGASAILRALPRQIHSPMIATRRYLCLFAIAFALGPRFAQAATVDSVSDCPRGAEVDAALAQLLRARVDRSTLATVSIQDLGARWSVEVAGRAAVYSDPNRDCVERTKVAAVFAALALEPPDLGDSSPAPSMHESTGSARPARTHRLDLAPAFLFAPGAGQRSSATTWGGSLRWLASGKRFGLTAGLQASYPAVAKVGEYELSLARISLDASATVSWRLGAAEFGIEIGPYGAVLLAHGRGLTPNASSTMIDAGGRIGLRARINRRWVSPFLAVQAELSARHFSLVVDPIGDVGSAPRLWLGVMAGVGISLGGGSR